jgi:hypothetical protein
MYTQLRYKFLYYLLNLQTFFELRSFMLNAQPKELWYLSINSLSGLNLNIPVNMRDLFGLSDFCVTLYICTLYRTYRQDTTYEKEDNQRWTRTVTLTGELTEIWINMNWLMYSNSSTKLLFERFCCPQSDHCALKLLQFRDIFVRNPGRSPQLP